MTGTAAAGGLVVPQVEYGEGVAGGVGAIVG